MSSLQNYDVSFNIAGQNSYMVMTLPSGSEIMDYCARMVELNKIKGLLPMHNQKINDIDRFYYDITGKTKLENYIKTNQITDKEAEKVLKNLVDGFINLGNYFLQENHCVLNASYVFVDQYLNTYIPYLPVNAPADIDSKRMAEFFLKILGDYFITQAKNDYYDQIVKVLIRSNFNMTDFKKVISRSEGDILPGNNGGGHTPTLELSAQRQPERERTEEVVIKQGAKPGPIKMPGAFPVPGSGPVPGGIPIPGVSPVPGGVPIPGGIPIPGGMPAPAPNGKNVKPDKKAKAELKSAGKKLNFGLNLGKKDQKPAIKQGNQIFYGGNNNGFNNAGYNNAGFNNVNMPLNQGNPGINNWEGTIIQNMNEATVIGSNQQNIRILHNGKYIPVTAFPFTIGKINASYVINKNVISRRHATIFEAQGNYYIQDENSTNHTFVNGIILAPFTPFLLQNNMQITLGNERITFFDR